MLDEFYAAVEGMKGILDSYKCNDCQESHDCKSLNRLLVMPHRTCVDEPNIYGPDHVSIQDCIDFVDGTATKCKYLIEFVPKVEIRIILQIMVDDLKNRASSCCRAGGVWKTCLRPILNKWYLWNQKWNLLRVPPDPAW